MKRCKRVFVFCLFCLTTGMTHTVHADNDQAQPLHEMPLAFAASFDTVAVTPPKQKSADKKTASGSPYASGWVSMDPGTRAAYVGIHGGTAPLSLFRASNGLLFAITGQTGNDFVHILRGGTVNGSAGQPQVHKSKADAKAIVHGIAPSKAQGSKAKDAVNAQAATKPDSLPVAAQSQQTALTAERDSTSGNDKPALPQPAPVAETAAPGQAPEKSGGPESVSAPPAREKTLEAIMASLPTDHASLIFASGELASSINDAQEVLAPFGFPLPGETTERTKTPPAAPMPRFTPVKLGDYRKLLGNV